MILYINMKMIKIILLWLVVGSVLYIQPCMGQQFSDIYLALKSKYPEEQAVYYKYFEDVDIALVKDSLVVKSKNYQEMVHLGTKSSYFARDQVYSSLFYKIDKIEAYSLIPNKKKFKKIKVTEYKETFDKNSSIFYDDSKYITFFYPAIEAGTHTVLEFDETITDARFVGSFLFSRHIPIVHGKYTLTVDSGVEVNLKLLHDTGNKVKISKENVGARIRYTYEVFDSEKIKSESRSPSVRYYTPHLNLIVRSYQDSKKNKRNVLSSSNDLYAWYRTFIKDLQQHENENVKAMVEGLVKNATSEEEKVRNIFYWVQNNIKYIAFEDGMRGLIPHNGAYVCEKRFGDCKDMASILVNMMHHAGIDAHFTWIGTRDIPYNYTDIPTPLVDNHMIATYKGKDTYYFLDATAQYSPFELPSSMIQGKEALIALNEKEHKIIKVPEIGRDINVINDTSYYRLEKGIVKGKGHTTLSGYHKVFSTYRLQRTNEKEVKEYLTSYLGRGSNKFFLDQYKVQNLQNLDKPTRIEYDFSVADYYREIGNEIYFNMNMDKTFQGELIDKDRKLPMENEFKCTNRIVSVLEIPAQYKLEHLPKNESYSNDIFGFTIQYKPEKGRIVMYKEWYVNYLLLQPQNFVQWNEAIKKLSEAYSETIILKRTDV